MSEFVTDRLPALLLVGLILLPNLLFLFFPPRNVPATEKPTQVMLVMNLLERCGQVGVFILPFFYTWQRISRVNFKSVILIAMGIFLLIYYLGWARFFFGGRNYSDLFTPLPGLPFIPVPMAIFPVSYFMLMAVLFSSVPMAVAVGILAVGHISTALHDYVANKHRYNYSAPSSTP